MKITVEGYTDPQGNNIRSTMEPDDASVLAFAKKAGYQEQVPDPDWEAGYSALMVELHSLEPGPERDAKALEVQAYRQTRGKLVPNPVSPGYHAVQALRAQIDKATDDEAALQNAAQKALEAERKRQAEAKKLNVKTEIID